MKKLIELLNEYIKDKDYRKIKFAIDEYKQLHCSYIVGDTVEGEPFSEKWLSRDVSQAYLISKEYGFIKWLVEKDKIDLEKLDEKAERKPQYTFTDDDGRLGFKLFEVYESLLMLLSIQDNPIEFLISILKDKKIRTVYVDEDGNVSGDTKRYTDC